MPVKLSYEKVVERLALKGITQLITTPEEFKTSSKLTIVCRCGELRTAPIYDIEVKPNCFKCGIKARAQSRKENNGQYSHIQEFMKGIGFKFITLKEDFLKGLEEKNATVRFQCFIGHDNELVLQSYNNKRDAYKNESFEFCHDCKYDKDKVVCYERRKQEILKEFEKFEHKFIDLDVNLMDIHLICGNCGTSGNVKWQTVSSDSYTGWCDNCLSARNMQLSEEMKRARHQARFQEVKAIIETIGLELLMDEHEYSSNVSLFIGCTQCGIRWNRISLYKVQSSIRKHFHCEICMKGESGITKTQFDPLCFNCYCVTHSDEVIPRRFKLKENIFVESFKQFMDEQKLDSSFEMPIYNKQLGGCSSKRPDVFIDFYTHAIMIELDENQHAGYSCENKRICQILEDIDHRPLVVLRMNPDQYKNYGVIFSGCFSYSSNGMIQVDKIEWKRRLDVLFADVLYYTVNVPNKTLTIKQYYYDSGEGFKPTNTSGHNGVFEEKDKNRWIAEWKVDGKKYRKYFSIKKYGYTQAYGMACEHIDSIKK